jgi:hypothetical protein
MGRRRKQRKAPKRRGPAVEVPEKSRTSASEEEVGERPEQVGTGGGEILDLDEIQRRVAELRGELIDALAPYEVFDAVANLWVVNSPFDPDTYQESAQEGLMAVSDYVALLCSERASREPTAPGGGPMDGPVIDRIDELTRAILGLSDLEMTVRASRSGDPFERLRVQLLSRRMIVQGPGFDFQETSF